MPLAEPERVRESLAALERLTYDPFYAPEELLAHVSRIHVALGAVDLAELDVAAVKAEAGELIRAIFTLSLAVRGRVPEWRLQGHMSRPVQKALRGTFLAT